MIFQPDLECMPREQLRELQGRRLTETVAWEYEHVPLYKKRMDEAGVSPRDIRTVDDLPKLPFMEKDDLRAEFPFGLMAAPREEIVRVQGSSGTTGHPIVAGYTQADIENWTDMVARAFVAAGAGSRDIIQICYGYGLFTGGLGAHQGASRLGAMVIPMSAGNTQRQIMMIRELGATMLCCTPSYAIYLGETMREMGLVPGRDIKLQRGCFGAEPWTEEMRTHLQDLLGIDARDIYGLTELGGPGVAIECEEKHGMHINEDHILAEIIDPKTGRQLPPGTPGEVVFTSLTKKGQPMLRYRTHDIATLDDTPCSCGRTGIRMSRITGRTDEMIVVRGVNLFPTQVEAVLVNVPGIAPHYTIEVDRVNSTDTLQINVELTEDGFSDTVSALEAIRGTIAEQIKSVVGVSAKINLVPPKSIPRSEGKAKHVFDKRNLH